MMKHTIGQRDDQDSFTTTYGSTIRCLLALANALIYKQSLAKAALPVVASVGGTMEIGGE